MRISLKKLNNKTSNKGFTFVEMTLTIGISLVVFMMIYRFFSSTRSHYMYGTVNLQNLHEARMAINYLRRDFSSACPHLQDGASFQDIQRLQKQVFAAKEFANDNVNLIQVTPNALAFYKFQYDSADENSRIEPINYTFSGTELKRIDGSGREKSFTGFKEVSFKLYTHQLNPNIPVLWVKFVIHEGENIYGTERIGNPLEITTTIASPFIAKNLENLAWRYETTHKN